MPKPIAQLLQILQANYQDPDANQKQYAHGVYSVCCTNEPVLRAAIRFAKRPERSMYPLVIESTSNQVDQFGGYTGMTPADFVRYVGRLAKEEAYDPREIVLGGDHLGPNAWQKESGTVAMAKAETLICDYVKAGYRKIHLDASMACAGDPCNKHGAIDDHLVASRAARLCQVAENTWHKLEPTQQGEAPIYIIGTEVPVPGGNKAVHQEESVEPTSPEAAQQTYQVTKETFVQHSLATVWERVVAMVVQPGVEFSDDTINHYHRDKAQNLSVLAPELGLCFEAHSTDYQQPTNLRNLVEDHYAILKVGPWLTYAYREALLSLGHIAKEMCQFGLLGCEEHTDIQVNFSEQLLAYMQQNPNYWQAYYKGTAQELAYKCLYSLSDRIRYYWPQDQMQQYVKSLLASLQGQVLPYSLVSQYFPQAIVRLEPSQWSAENLIIEHIQTVLAQYEYAISHE